MITYVALLRGINVGGHKLIKMQELREMLTEMGLAKVRTYIQSGNIVFQSEQAAEQLQRQIGQEIKKKFGFEVLIMVRTRAEGQQIISSCPFPVDALPEGESVHLSLMGQEPGDDVLQLLLESKGDAEEFQVNGREMYTYHRQSVRDSKLKLKTPSTMRNWKTVKKIEALLVELD